VGRLGLVGAACVLTAAVGCASTTAPNPPGPPAREQRPYAGRIVLSTPALSDDIDALNQLWVQRLSILGLPSHVVYDDTRAVFDVYGAPASALGGVAGALTDPGGWMGHRLDDASLTEWTPATPACDCGGQMSVAVGGAERCNWGNTSGPVEIQRPGSPSLWVAGWSVIWHHRVKLGSNVEGTSEGDSDHRDLKFKCPEEEWPKAVVFRLLPGTSWEQGTAVALALGGGRLPEIPHVDSVAPASGATPR
jgi:hypothetical protein